MLKVNGKEMTVTEWRKYEASPMVLEMAKAARERAKNRTIRHEVKIGRNDPCPCGSGRKYKKCCG